MIIECFDDEKAFYSVLIASVSILSRYIQFDIQWSEIDKSGFIYRN